MTLHWHARSIADLPDIATALLAQIGNRRIITFTGNMGAGKTTFIKVLCQQLGVVDAVSSPTYSLANEYHTAKQEKVFHLDLYRLNDIDEAMHIGIEEYLYADAYCLIEWAEIIVPLLPDDVVRVSIQLDDAQQGRLFVVEL
ncbi:MAG: tRNA (adenosine(37)-N6)-threonylcarbamoyltransferase complex ATPase subunit type 1 TsaE [Chitinophagales bacterium]|nr:tRNA (adenosine(37)-N6)-threonylcarbamoyltransferase complex ATPase subunit type 1 TsaE [Chitinophagales bacterium]HNL06539.1 tRNA (adenosine(37)-N6)-threonylcarbamoyltransferase complex ATPase subunit type 1 TsaE [Chitinophagales bacterium]